MNVLMVDHGITGITSPRATTSGPLSIKIWLMRRRYWSGCWINMFNNHPLFLSRRCMPVLTLCKEIRLSPGNTIKSLLLMHQWNQATIKGVSQCCKSINRDCRWSCLIRQEWTARYDFYLWLWRTSCSMKLAIISSSFFISSLSSSIFLDGFQENCGSGILSHYAWLHSPGLFLVFFMDLDIAFSRLALVDSGEIRVYKRKQFIYSFSY